MTTPVQELEDIFHRIEKSLVSPTKLEIQNWLAGPKRSASSYKNIAVILQEPFAIRNAVVRTNNLDEAEDLYNQSTITEIFDSKTENLAKSKFEKLQREEVERQEQLLANEIVEREELKERIKYAEKVEEIKTARKELRELSPKSYGGIKSGETRRALSSFRKLF